MTFTGTTGDGMKVTAGPFTIPPSSGFVYFPFPSTFTALKSVSWAPGTTLATNIVANDLLPYVAPVSLPSVQTTSALVSHERDCLYQLLDHR